MSEKLTFQELIESIAEETDNSKQFTRDFIKDFVDIISDGLKSGDNVNIAGFGKFKLQKIDEREGYNPQTEEKMTIPAHQKMVFKPYKDLREIVNAPYAHLEATLIEEAKNDSESPTDPNKKDAAKSNEPEPAEDQNPVIDELESLLLDKSDDEESTEKTSDPFSLNNVDFDFVEGKEEENIEDDDDITEEDIVEYRDEPDLNEHEMDENLAEFMGSAEDEYLAEEDERKEEAVTKVNYSPASPLGVELEDETTTDHAKVAIPPDAVNLPSPKKSSSTVVLVTAILVLMIATGVWYFSTLYDAGVWQTESKGLISATVVPSKKGTAGQQPQQSKVVTQTVSNQTDEKVQNRSNTSKELVIADGATLWSIAGTQLGNPRLWPWIYDSNKSIENPDLIFAGATLSVPRPSGIPSGLSSSDSIAVAKGYIAAYLWYKKHESSKAKSHLWAAKKYHRKIRSLANIQIEAKATNSGRAR